MRVAVVGAGYWGPNLIRNLLSVAKVKSLIACDSSASRLESLKSRFPQVEVTLDFATILADPTIYGVVIATPISTHARLGSAVLESGKHVFIEKPLAHSAREAEQLIALAQKSGRVLMVGHTFEYSPPVLRTQELIARGELGRIYFISVSRVNLGLHQRDASVIWDLVPHDFSILFHWLKETPVLYSVTGRACVQRGVPDVAFIHLKFPSGIIANIEVAWLAPSKLRRTTIVGDRKMLVYDDNENIEKVKIYDQGVDFKDPETFGEYQLSYRAGDIVSPRLPSTEPLKLEMEHFIQCIDRGLTPRTDGASGLRVVRALECAERALTTGLPVETEPEIW